MIANLCGFWSFVLFLLLIQLLAIYLLLIRSLWLLVVLVVASMTAWRFHSIQFLCSISSCYTCIYICICIYIGPTNFPSLFPKAPSFPLPPSRWCASYLFWFQWQTTTTTMNNSQCIFWLDLNANKGQICWEGARVGWQSKVEGVGQEFVWQRLIDNNENWIFQIQITHLCLNVLFYFLFIFRIENKSKEICNYRWFFF